MKVKGHMGRPSSNRTVLRGGKVDTDKKRGRQHEDTVTTTPRAVKERGLTRNTLFTPSLTSGIQNLWGINSCMWSHLACGTSIQTTVVANKLVPFGAGWRQKGGREAGSQEDSILRVTSLQSLTCVSGLSGMIQPQKWKAGRGGC